MKTVNEDLSLQEAFKKFQEKRKKLISKDSRNFVYIKRTQEQKNKLRNLFINQAKKYIGVPYARKYFCTNSLEYHSSLFLDCCGLIRRVLSDLREEFGFLTGPWNQAYQFDTLPKSVAKSDLEPGDLVFVSGTYYNEKSKTYPHNLVHVEIWLGDDDKTIGARWKTGKVEIHESYQFVAKSYHSMEYHFKSIDTWLDGICKSHCADHPWRRTKHIDPSKYSVFACESDEDEEEVKATKDLSKPDRVPKENPCSIANYLVLPRDTHHGTTTIANGGQTMKDSEQKKKPHPMKSQQSEKNASNPKNKIDQIERIKEPRYQNRKFYIGGNNGVAIIEKPLVQLGMTRTEDEERFFFKWVELKRTINYAAFKPGFQMVNHIPSINCLTTKLGLLQTLKEYERQTLRRTSTKKTSPVFKISEFFMESFKLNEERKLFMDTFKEGEIWICKPSGKNQGKGIYLINDVKQLKEHNNPTRLSRTSDWMVQRYIMNPLLINGYKFDVRVYMLIAWTTPFLVFYHDGYVRLSCVPYSNDTLDLHAHLTNQYVQKKHPSYAEKKDDTVLSFHQLNDYINVNLKDERGLEQNWVYHVFAPTMKSIMLTCFKASKLKLGQQAGMFELLGFDFMIDDNMKVWLIEININPALHTNCAVLKEVIPPMVEETINVVVEVFNKQKSASSMARIDSLKTFQPILNAATGFQYRRISRDKGKQGGTTFTEGCLSSTPPQTEET